MGTQEAFMKMMEERTSLLESIDKLYNTDSKLYLELMDKVIKFDVASHVYESALMEEMWGKRK